MSAKQYDVNDRGDPVKKAGWFSWRHKSSEAHGAAGERYRSEHGRGARKRKADERERRNIVTDCGECGRRHSIDRPCYVATS
jgi:hypothetical protein